MNIQTKTTANILRRILKANFPTLTFSVRQNNTSSADLVVTYSGNVDFNIMGSINDLCSAMQSDNCTIVTTYAA